MSLEYNKELARRYFEAFQTGNGAIYDEILAESFTVHTRRDHGKERPIGESGPSLFKRLVANRDSGFSNSLLTVDEIVAEGDRMIVAWTFSGLHSGIYAGVPATGKRIVYRGVNSFQVADGKLLVSWDLKDSLFLFQQLGALPSTPEILANARQGKPD